MVSQFYRLSGYWHHLGSLSLSLEIFLSTKPDRRAKVLAMKGKEQKAVLWKTSANNCHHAFIPFISFAFLQNTQMKNDQSVWQSKMYRNCTEINRTSVRNISWIWNIVHILQIFCSILTIGMYCFLQTNPQLAQIAHKACRHNFSIWWLSLKIWKPCLETRVMFFRSKWHISKRKDCQCSGDPALPLLWRRLELYLSPSSDLHHAFAMTKTSALSSPILAQKKTCI